MELGLTIPLQRYLRQKTPAYGTQADLRLCWDLHLLTPGGQPSLIAVHCSSRFTLFLYGLSQVEWKHYPALLETELNRALIAEGYTPQQAARYREIAGTLCLTKTHGRRPVAFLNRAVDDFYALPTSLNSSTLTQPQVVEFINNLPCHAAGHTGRQTARQFFTTDMQALLG